MRLEGVNMEFKIPILIVLILILSLFSSTSGKSALDSDIGDHVVINEIFDADNETRQWLELYNPTECIVNVSGWVFWFSSLHGPVNMPIKSIYPKEYIIFCANKETFMRLWSLPKGVRCFEIMYGFVGDEIWLSRTMDIKKTIDRVPSRVGISSMLDEGHSWARYRGGYDTDDFTNDFYDEPNPTPGYENNMVKDNDDGISDESHPESNNEKEVWKEFLAGTIAIIVILIPLLFYVSYWRKGREKRKQELYKKDREDK